MHVDLIEQSDRRLRFRNSNWRGWVFVVFGVLLAGAGPVLGGPTVFFVLVFTLPSLGIGLWAISTRCELTLDLQARRFEVCRGHWPSPQTSTGSFEQITCVALRRPRMERRQGRHLRWTVLLEIDGWPPLSIFWSRDEAPAVECFEHYAELLQIPALDRSTGSRSVETKDILERLERMPSVAPRAVGLPSAPPDEGQVAWHDDGHGATITLKRGGYTGGAWFPSLFAVAFTGAGGLFLTSATGFTRLVSSRGFAWTGGVLFSFVGLSLVALLTLGLCSRQVVREVKHEIIFELSMLGRSLHTQRWPKPEVNGVARMLVPGRVPAHGPTISPDEQLGPQASEVIVRRGDDLVRLARGADIATQEWLCRTLQQLVAR